LVAVLIPAPPNYVPPEIASGALPPLLIILGVATLALIPILLNTRKKMFFDAKRDSAYANDEEAQSAYFTMALTSWVFGELIGVFGLVMAYLTFDMLMSLPFVLVAAILLVAFRPRPTSDS
jgi:hypothetical protein